MKKYLLLFFAAAGFIAANAYIANTIVSNKLTHVVDKLPIPKIMVVDLDSMINSKLEQGADPKEIIAYSDKVLELLRHEGFLIIEKRFVLHSPASYKLREFSFEELDELVKESGIKLLKDEAYQKSLEAGIKKAEKLFGTNNT